MEILKPLGDRVVIEPIAEDAKTAGGIIVNTQQQSLLRGTVVAVGPGRYQDAELLPTTLVPGQTVIYPRHGYDTITSGDKVVHVMSELNIIAVFASE